MLAGDRLIFISPALRDDWTRVAVQMRAPNMFTNYCQFVAQATAISTVMKLTQMYGIPEWDRLSQQQLLEYRKKKNRALMFGEPFRDVTTDANGRPRWQTGGIRYWASLYNVFNFNGAFTWSLGAQAIQPVRRYAKSRTLFGICGVNVHTIMSQLPQATDTARTDMMSEKFGFDIRVLKFPGCTLALLLDYNYEGDFLDDEIVVTDFTDMEIKRFMPDTLEVDVQDPGAGRKQTQLIGALGLSVKRPIASAIWKGIQYAAN